MLDKKRESYKELEVKIGKIFTRCPITPDQWTLLSILFGFASLFFVIHRSFIWAIILFWLAGLADFLNGIIARERKIYTPIFRYLDTVSDRYVDGFMFFGLLFLPLPQIILPGYVWVYLIILGALTTAFAKSAAKEKDVVNYELKGGFLTHSERVIVLSVALFLGMIDKSFVYTTYVLIFMAVATNFTTLQRIYNAVQAGNKNN